jgi:signal transduction histidine kinase
MDENGLIHHHSARPSQQLTAMKTFFNTMSKRTPQQVRCSGDSHIHPSSRSSIWIALCVVSLLITIPAHISAQSLPDGMHVLSIPPETPVNIRDIDQDAKGTLWMIGFQSLYRYDGTTFTRISSAQNRQDITLRGVYRGLNVSSDGWLAINSAEQMLFYHSDRMMTAEYDLRLDAHNGATATQILNALADERGRIFCLLDNARIIMFDPDAPAFPEPSIIELVSVEDHASALSISRTAAGAIRVATSRGVFLVSHDDSSINVSSESAAPAHPASTIWSGVWFPGTIVGAGIFLFLAAYLAHRSKMRALDNLRFSISSDLHDEIGSDLSAIALEADLIARHTHLPKEDWQDIFDIGRKVRGAARKLRDVVWIMDPEQDSVEYLAARIREVCRTMLSGIETTVDIQDSIPDEVLSIEVKRNVLLMFKEILNNIVRHADATHVLVDARFVNNTFQLCVKDNGVGFDALNTPRGRGLHSISDRAKTLGGVLTIDAIPGSGTLICFKGRITRM